MNKDIEGKLPKVVAVIAAVLLLVTTKGIFLLDRAKTLIIDNLLLVLIGIILFLWWRAKR